MHLLFDQPNGSAVLGTRVTVPVPGTRVPGGTVYNCTGYPGTRVPELKNGCASTTLRHVQLKLSSGDRGALNLTKWMQGSQRYLLAVDSRLSNLR